MTAEQLNLPLRFLELVECGLGVDHHLRRKPSGLWQLRVTIDQGEKYVGRRVVIGLATRDARTARERRDRIMGELRKLGKIK